MALLDYNFVVNLLKYKKTIHFINLAVLSAVFSSVFFTTNAYAGTCYETPARGGPIVGASCLPGYAEKEGCFYAVPLLGGVGGDSMGEIDCNEAAAGKIVPVNKPPENAEPQDPTKTDEKKEAFSEPLKDLKDNPILLRLVEIIDFLSVGVAVVVVGAIAISGVQYVVSQGNPQKTAAARNRIISSLVAVALYMLMYAILQWLVPGGLF